MNFSIVDFTGLYCWNGEFCVFRVFPLSTKSNKIFSKYCTINCLKNVFSVENNCSWKILL